MSHRPSRLPAGRLTAARAAGHKLVAAGAAAVLIIVSLTAWSPGASASPGIHRVSVETQVYAELAADGSTDFLVYLTETADLAAASGFATRSARTQYVYDQLTRVARISQADLRADLDGRGVAYTPYWAVNAVLVTGGDRALLDELATRPDVTAIEATHEYRLLPTEQADRAVTAAINAVEWGVADIGADHAWNVFGAFGQRITVATIDTGVEFKHSALVRQYRGNIGGGAFNHNHNWFDPAGICPAPAPCDNVGHGTHVTGTMVGDDNAGNQIGVAPRARWIAAKGCEFASCSTASLLASGQWMLAPTDLAGMNPDPTRAPHVVNNSWGGGGGNLFYQFIINAWVNAGIFPAFSAGNSGAIGCSSTGSPGDNIPAYAAGAYDINHAIAPFSGKGPSLVDGVTVKPNVAAPGVNVRSSLPGNTYGNLSGTSMASPHVAGTVALVWSASPTKIGNIPLTRAIIDATAINVNDLTCGGVPANNNVWGQGRLDAFNAVWLAISI